MFYDVTVEANEAGTTHISNHCPKHPKGLPYAKIRLAVYEIDQPDIIPQSVSNKPNKY